MGHKEHEIFFVFVTVDAKGKRHYGWAEDTQEEAEKSLQRRRHKLREPNLRCWIERHEEIVDVVWATEGKHLKE